MQSNTETKMQTITNGNAKSAKIVQPKKLSVAQQKKLEAEKAKATPVLVEEKMDESDDEDDNRSMRDLIAENVVVVAGASASGELVGANESDSDSEKSDSEEEDSDDEDERAMRDLRAKAQHDMLMAERTYALKKAQKKLPELRNTRVKEINSNIALITAQMEREMHAFQNRLRDEKLKIAMVENGE